MYNVQVWDAQKDLARINLRPQSSSAATNTNTNTDAESYTSVGQLAGGYSLHDLGLMHYFTLHSSQTLDAINSVQYHHIWQHDVPMLAQSNAFLMHALLSFAAAHRSTTLGPTSMQDLQSSRSHYGKALENFRQAVTTVTAQQADAMMCFCTLISFITLRFDTVQPSAGQDSIDAFINLLRVLQSSIGVLTSIKRHLQLSVVGGLLAHTRQNQQHQISSVVATSLGSLERLVLTRHVEFGLTASASAAIHDCLGKLRQFYTMTNPRPTSWAHLLSWPIQVGQSKHAAEFLSLLERRNAVALCLVAHWTVAAVHAPQKWYVGDWPNRLLLAIRRQTHGIGLDDVMRWPLRETVGTFA
ncbi:hypothetical protein CLAFUW4_06162 [Fulvia fulva]|uniref:Uncharacterized protein n=1 Tax=Passalora fulva TaxID=5499 RepID=A0A9Q8LIP6_PASFU|nr:uncharacterized protein CLAFUR5_06306 [Fulvia fulva]KAK4624540.1 hypothetical protein CLAFUR4_06165 [Fulvia fulva]KAK4625901.1 hypothetical protein CLAFUR0_06169 [Fulvia fulva]UJO18366.1 hypothetical protein CLAFUR5_06306 [Fulvia fulva]WPV15276.1 hypothetical protein CLAFUW4_06162 [Fulvia fulva]WPV30079.1 hypothetical protein CLAFUW7_06158 [Fulvia fulva]